MHNFQLLVHEPSDDALALSLIGEFDMASVTTLKTAIEMATASSNYKTLVLDLSRLTFMDSSGLHMLSDTNRAMRAAGGTMRVVSPSDNIRKIFELTGLDHVLTIVADRKAALAAA
jgi:anti-sigma B factor antagonist